MLEVQEMDVSKLIPYVGNARKHDDTNVAEIASSINEYGFNDPIAVNEKDNVIIEGHGRLLAAKMLGMEKVPVLKLGHLTDAQIKGYTLIHNRLAEKSEWDKEVLETELQKLVEMDFDVGLTGFETEDLAEMDLDIGFGDSNDNPGEGAEDEIPEVEDNPYGVKRGDIWLLGEHRLLCGDSTDKADVDKLMDGAKADMVFTDPPYGYSYESNRYKSGNPHGMLKNDEKILDFMPCLKPVLATDAAIFICGSHQTIEVWKSIVSKIFKYKNMIVWKKNNWSMGDLKGAFAGQHELIIFAHHGRVELVNGRPTDVWEFDRDPPKDHPTQKPVDLIEYAIKSVPSSIVLDLFLGSGSTLIACEKTDRQCYGMEIDPHYCSVIIKRWEEYTGKEATKWQIEEAQS